MTIKHRHIPLSQDAALVVALAGTAMPFAHSAEDEAERWLRALRLHGQVGVGASGASAWASPRSMTGSDARPSGDGPAPRPSAPKILDDVAGRAERASPPPASAETSARPTSSSPCSTSTAACSTASSTCAAPAARSSASASRPAIPPRLTQRGR